MLHFKCNIVVIYKTFKKHISCMSDEIEKKDGFVKNLISTTKEYTELLNELRGDTEDLDIESERELEFIVRPSAKEIVEEAYVELLNEVGNKEDIPFDDPQPVILESERQFALIRDAIVKEIERIQEKEEGSVTGADIDTMLYIVDKNAGKSSQFTIFGGAESLIYNTGNKYDWHPYETELILIANRIAADKNNLQRHTLLDTTLIVPNDERIVYHGL